MNAPPGAVVRVGQAPSGDAEAQAVRNARADLARRGCRYLQFDEVFFAYLCDPKLREQVKAAKHGAHPASVAIL